MRLSGMKRWMKFQTVPGALHALLIWAHKRHTLVWLIALTTLAMENWSLRDQERRKARFWDEGQMPTGKECPHLAPKPRNSSFGIGRFDVGSLDVALN